MRRRRYYSFRGELGSILYRLIYACFILLGIKFFGTSVIDDLIFILIGGISFEIVGFILRKSGIWRY